VRDLETENSLPALFQLDARDIAPGTCSDGPERFQRSPQRLHDGFPLLLVDRLSPPGIEVMSLAVFMVMRKTEGPSNREVTPKAAHGEGVNT
jgi:hypothetical protein